METMSIHWEVQGWISRATIRPTTWMRPTAIQRFRWSCCCRKLTGVSNRLMMEEMPAKRMAT